jgi:hypothetical protein
MALLPLASTSDLTDRKVAVPAGIDANKALLAASAAIRDAAGTAITRTTTTLRLLPTGGPWLDLYVSPVREVTRVVHNGVEVHDWELHDGRLWRPGGWHRSGWSISQFIVDVDFGYDQAPDDIIDLCCSLAAASFAAMEDGYDPGRGLSAISIDDYRESFARGDDEVVNPLEIPERTRNALRRRFGRSVYGTGSR